MGKKVKKNLTFCGLQEAELSSSPVYIEHLRAEKCKCRMVKVEVVLEAFSGQTTTTTILKK